MTRPCLPAPDRLRSLTARTTSPALKRLARMAEALLRRSGFLARRDVSCNPRGRSLELRGRLPSYGLRLLARAIVAEVAGAWPLLDRIEVVPMTARPSTGSDRNASGDGIGRPIPFGRTTRP